MLIVLALVIAGGWFAYGRILPIFAANPLLNGTIFLVFLLGILTCFWQVAQLFTSVNWIERFAAGRTSPADRGATDGAEGTAAPRLLAPLAALLSGRGPMGGVISTESARSIQDSVATRIDEGRDITRYLANLLIFLGLLGTFYGLATTVPAIVDTIRTLAPDQGESGVQVFDKLMHGLETQLGGMATAFSSSLLGLAGSLVVGLLELFAGHGQNRFYRELEEWLSSFTRIGLGAGDASLDQAALVEFLDGIGHQVAGLQDFYASRDILRDEEAADADARSLALAQGVERLSALLGQDRDALAATLSAERTQASEMQGMLVSSLEQLLDGQARLVTAAETSGARPDAFEGITSGLEQALLQLSDGQNRLVRAAEMPAPPAVPPELTEALARISDGQQRLAEIAAQVPEPAAPLMPAPELAAQRETQLARSLGRLADGQARLIELTEARPGPADDPEARMRLRSIDVQLGRLVEESASGRDGLIAELREDMAALSRAIRSLEGRHGS